MLLHDGQREMGGLCPARLTLEMPSGSLVPTAVLLALTFLEQIPGGSLCLLISGILHILLHSGLSQTVLCVKSPHTEALSWGIFIISCLQGAQLSWEDKGKRQLKCECLNCWRCCTFLLGTASLQQPKHSDHFNYCWMAFEKITQSVCFVRVTQSGWYFSPLCWYSDVFNF